MKGIILNLNDYFKFFIIIVILFFLSSCSTTTPSGPIISSFTADNTTIDEGDNVTLSWSVTDASTVTINPGGMMVALSGSTSVSPTETTTYTLNAINSAGSSSATVTIKILKREILIPNEIQSKDTFVSNDIPSTNFDGAPYLAAGTLWGSGTIERTYLQFDVSTIPNNAVITEAKVGLFFKDPMSYVSIPIYVEVPLAVYEVEEYWDEASLNWDNQPAANSVYEDVQTLAGDTNKYIYWDITNLVQGWVSGMKSNYGIRLADEDEMTLDDGKHFGSSSAPVGTERPKLMISYYIP
jgi:hypothetical protein